MMCFLLEYNIVVVVVVVYVIIILLSHVDKAVYTFCEALGPVDIPVTPVPVAESMRETSNYDNLRLVELLGEDFSPELTVWFGDVQALTTAYR